jgi:hypothetical protein
MPSRPSVESFGQRCICNAFFCGQDAILPDECLYCGGDLHRVRQGGFSGLHGWRYCSEDCMADDQEWMRKQHAQERARDELPDWVERDMDDQRRARGITVWEPEGFDRVARERGWP